MRILLLITGGIAAYKTPELVRRLRDVGATVTCVMTEAAQRFVTPLALSAVSEQPVYSHLWDLKDEREMGHIRLSREADQILVAPASANFIARLTTGQGDDLASAVLLAADKPATLAPAMNHRMWQHPATQRNVQQLRADGYQFLGPVEGAMACGEFGLGRLLEVPDLVAALTAPKPLLGRRALVTSGPTVEALDPVRYLSNHSSGRQGAAIAAALARAGAQVTLVSGPTAQPRPQGVDQVDVRSAADMLAAAKAALPADILVCAAAVADYSPREIADEKIKKDGQSLHLTLEPTVDILATLCAQDPRPTLSIGFAAETGDLAARATAKRARKGCDWMLANDVGARPEIFGGQDNQILFVAEGQSELWPLQSKTEVAAQLVAKITEHLAE